MYKHISCHLNCKWTWLWLFKVTFMSKVIFAIGIPIWVSIGLQNLSDLELTFMVTQCQINGAIRLPIYVFLLMFNSNKKGPNWAPLWDTRLRNLRDLELYLQGHLRANVTVPLDSIPIYGFLLIFNSYIGLHWALLRDIIFPNFGCL